MSFETVRPVYAKVDEEKFEFRGTGFFIEHDNEQYFITAKHVSDTGQLFIYNADPNRILPEGVDKGFYPISSALIEIRLVESSDVSDLAILKCDELRVESPLTISEEALSSGREVLTIEHAQFRENRQITHVHIDEGVSIRRGHIVRLLSSEHDEFNREGSFEVSFPAPKGASGAPVVAVGGAENGEVIGVIIGSATYDLEPIVSAAGDREDVRYQLPAGIAISAEKLTSLLSSIT